MSAATPMPDLSYPIGRFAHTDPLDEVQREAAIAASAATPAKLRAAVHGLSAQQLDTPYRPGGWMVRQVVHHLPDSHGNAFFRTKLALTENEPTIKPYDEKRWAELPDARLTPIETSLVMLDAIHERWNYILREMSESNFARTFRHPEQGSAHSLLAGCAVCVAWAASRRAHHEFEAEGRVGVRKLSIVIPNPPWRMRHPYCADALS